MYAELPDQLKRIVTEYLLADDFRTAKQIHDDWILERKFTNQNHTELAA